MQSRNDYSKPNLAEGSWENSRVQQDSQFISLHKLQKSGKAKITLPFNIKWWRDHYEAFKTGSNPMGSTY